MQELDVTQAPDLGAVLYEKSNAKSFLDAPKGKVGAKGWAQRIYMLVLGAALLGWFLYSLITSAKQPDVSVGRAIVKHLAAFFVLILAEMILMFTAFGVWGKFARAALRHKVLTRQRRMEGVKTRQLEAEIKEADANKDKENAIRIYDQYVAVVNNGEETLLNKNDLQRVKCEARPMGYQLTFCKYDGEELVADALLPLSDLPLVKKYFDRCDYTPAERGKGYLKKKFPMLAFTFLPVLIGVALICVHCLVLPQMPVVFGILFLALGVLLVIGQFSDVAVIKHGVMPIGGGLIVMALPLAALVTLVGFVKEFTYVSLLSTFTAAHAALALFVGFGPMLIIMGIAGIVDCTRL